MDKAYHFKVRVKLPDETTREEEMTVSEAATKFGSAVALGKVVRYYDNLKAYKVILDYRVYDNLKAYKGILDYRVMV